MQKYTESEIVHFLKTMDEFLSKKVEIIVIGGSAAMLAYKATRATLDIDTFNSIEDLKKAHAAAQKKLGRKISLEQATVADGPYNFEDRLKEIDLGMSHLKIKVPEIHDLILMKAMRAYEHDQDVIKEMVAENEVELSLLVDRYLKEMTHVTGDQDRLRGNFLAVVETAFGEKAADEVAEKIVS